MATKKQPVPLLVRVKEETPPSTSTGGRLIDQISARTDTRSAYIVPVHWQGMSYGVALGDLVGGWDDLRFAATAINPPGLASDPDFDTTRGGWLFADNSTELLFVIGQLPHLYKEGTGIRPHVHWIQENAGDVYWQLDYKWFNNGESPDANFTALTTTDKSFAYSATSPATGIAQISSFGEIDGTDMRASSVLMMKLSRIGGNGADTYTGDALMVEFDIHYMSDGHGTQLEYIKLD